MENYKNRYIFIVSTINLKEKSYEDLMKEYEIFKIKYNTWRKSTFEEFINFQKEWARDRYELTDEDNAYFLEFDKAKEAVEENINDINDSGVYNYALIRKVNLNSMYAKQLPEEIYIFKFNKQKMKYDLNEDINDEEYKFIHSSFNR